MVDLALDFPAMLFAFLCFLDLFGVFDLVDIFEISVFWLEALEIFETLTRDGRRDRFCSSIIETILLKNG